MAVDRSATGRASPTSSETRHETAAGAHRARQQEGRPRRVGRLQPGDARPLHADRHAPHRASAERKIGLSVEELLSGPEGGDTQIAARVAMREVDAVFFLVDPLATNLSTA